MAKRDLERMREILLHLEGQDSDDGWIWTRSDEFYRASDDHQIELMKQAGFLESGDRTKSSLVTDRLRITFSGHDYIDAIRNEGIWAETKNAVVETGGSATVEIVKSLAVGFLKKKISTHTGIKL
jgi:hypothetical protein